MAQEGQSGSTISKDVSPRMVLKRVMKSSPHHVQKQKKFKPEEPCESLAVALKSHPSPTAHFDQADHSATPVSSRIERRSEPISYVPKANGTHSTEIAHQAEVPKLMIKLKPVLPKASHSGFPFIFTNSDSDNSQPVGALISLKRSVSL